MAGVSLGAATRAPTLVRIGDQEIQIGPITYYLKGVVQREIDRLAQNPLQQAAATLEALPGPERRALFERALEACAGWSPPQIDSSRGAAFLNHHPELIEFLIVSLIVHYNGPNGAAHRIRTDIDRERASELYRQLTDDDVAKIMAIAYDQDPEAYGDPKAPEPSPEDIEKQRKMREVVEALERLRDAEAARSIGWGWARTTDDSSTGSSVAAGIPSTESTGSET